MKEVPSRTPKEKTRTRRSPRVGLGRRVGRGKPGAVTDSASSDGGKPPYVPERVPLLEKTNSPHVLSAGRGREPGRPANGRKQEGSGVHARGPHTEPRPRVHPPSSAPHSQTVRSSRRRLAHSFPAASSAELQTLPPETQSSLDARPPTPTPPPRLRS